jgi:hypothetical protein
MAFTGPIVDGVSLTATPAELVFNKSYNNLVPLIVGSNRDEFAYFTVGYPDLYGTPPDLTEAQFDQFFETRSQPPLNDSQLARLKAAYDPDGSYVYPPTDMRGKYSSWVRTVPFLTLGCEGVVVFCCCVPCHVMPSWR